ncbi:MAG: flagellin [Negativicutes bacterium]|nr:flagellin [Negativicutes bacterium]
MRILDTTSALHAVNQLNKNTAASTKMLQKLASGYQINCAADNAAGLAISEKMRGQIRGLEQAARNIQDGMSYLNTADGYLADIQDPALLRLRELAVQASNGILTQSDQQAIQDEVDEIKAHLQQTFRSAQFNTIPIFAQDIKKIKTPIPGVLSGDTLIRQYGLTVTTDNNDHLTFRLDDAEYELTLNPGYYTADQLVTSLNNKFAAAGTDITVSFEKDSLVYHSPTKVLDSLGGSMMEIDSPLAYTSIIYDNRNKGHIQGSYIQGREDLSDGVTINSTNNTLSFRLGDAGTYTNVTITFLDGTYTAAQIADTLNNYFTAKTYPITASLTSGKYLKIQHDLCGSDYTLDQWGGTAKAVILDQLVTSTISESYNNSPPDAKAIFTGYGTLPGSLDIQAGKNDTFRFSVDGISHTLTLSAGTYSPATLVDHLNSLFTANSISVTAALSGGKLQLTYTGSASGSIGGTAGTAAYTLLGGTAIAPTESPGTYYFVEGSTEPHAGNHASVSGHTALNNGVQIVAGFNDTLTFNLNGSPQSLTLAAGWYSSGALVSALNSALGSLDVTSSYNGSALVFTHKMAGGGIPQFPYSLNNFAGNALSTLMTTPMPVNTATGTSSTYSRVTGIANIENLTITAGVNDGLTVSVNNTAHTLTLDAGTYTKTDLLTMLNQKLTDEGIGSQITALASGSNLQLKALTPGTGTTFNSVSGTSSNTLFRATTTYYNNASAYSPSEDDTYIDGRLNLAEDTITISSGKNDVLAFDLTTDGVIERKSITLAAGEYDPASLVSMLNQKLQEAGLDVQASVKSVTTPQKTMPVLSLTYEPGKNGNFVIDGVGGSASYSIFYPGPYNIEYTGGEKLYFQVGANTGNRFFSGTQLVMNLEVLGLNRLDMTTWSGAQQALEDIDTAVASVSAAQGLIGSKYNALQTLYDNVTLSAENLQAAEARIRDTDMAKTMAEQIKLSVLMQAGTAALIQANQQPQTVLSLLENR